MFDFHNLDTELRDAMLAEFERDISAEVTYLSKRFTDRGIAEYPDLMRAAIGSGDEETLRDALNVEDRIALTELRLAKTVKVPRTAAATSLSVSMT